MRRNTVTYWTTADFANHENCSFIRLNDAFRKTLLQVAKKKTRKLTDHGKQLVPRADFKCQCFMTRGELWEMIGRGEVPGGWERCKQHIKHTFFDLMQLVRGFFY